MSDSPSQRWLDDFVRAYTVLRPVDATFIGFHDQDHRLPDFSENGVGDRVATMEGLLARARRLEGERGSRATVARPLDGGRGSGGTPPPGGAGVHSGAPATIEALDLQLAVGYLKLSLWETESDHFHRANPSYFTGEAIFGVLSLFLSEFAPLSHRVDAAIRRLEAVPRFLKEARHWLGHGPGSPPAWTRRALAECDGALAFLGDGIDALAAELLHPAPPLLSTDPGPMEGGVPRDPANLASGLHDAARTAARAFAEFRTFLATQDRPGKREVGCGPEVLDLHIREGHFLREQAREIAGAAREEMEATRGWLEAHARDFGARSPGEALAQLRDRHPGPGEYLDRYREIWEECRRVAVRENLVTWPDFPIRYLPRPRWARAAAPHLYFLFYRSPAAYRRPPLHPYLVAPLPDSLDRGGGNGAPGPVGGPNPVEEFLRTHNDGVIRANHIIHHGGLGHHVQNWHAFRAPSRIGRMAAVDGPARIAMHCGGTMAEGWACYATHLMAELAEAGIEGGMTRLEAYAEHASRVRMCCRAIVDVELHAGRMDLDEAAAFYREHADMSEAAAAGEAVKNSMFPGMALMYHTGLREILRVRQEVSAALGADFDLRAFHDRFLSWGSIPVTLAGELTRAVLVQEHSSPVPSAREGG